MKSHVPFVINECALHNFITSVSLCNTDNVSVTQRGNVSLYALIAKIPKSLHSVQTTFLIMKEILISPISNLFSYYKMFSAR